MKLVFTQRFDIVHIWVSSEITISPAKASHKSSFPSIDGNGMTNWSHLKLSQGEILMMTWCLDGLFMSLSPVLYLLNSRRRSPYANAGNHYGKVWLAHLSSGWANPPVMAWMGRAKIDHAITDLIFVSPMYSFYSCLKSFRLPQGIGCMSFLAEALPLFLLSSLA